MTTKRKPSDKRKKPTSKSVPGTGMARRAAEAIEERRRKRKKILNEATGRGRKKK